MEARAAGFGRGTALALGVAFVLALWLPLLDWVLDFAPELPNFEKREYARLPSLLPPADAQGGGLAGALERLDRFPAGFEAWHDDHFGLRSQLVRGHNLVVSRVLASPPNDEVVIGRDGWLYYAGQSNIEQYRALTLMPPELVRGWELYLAMVREWVEDHGARFLLVIGPSKPSIHPEHLPGTIRRVGTRTRLAQFTDELAREGRQWVLDLSDVLLAARAERPTYQKTDTHWNSWGSLVATRALVEELRASGAFPAVEPLSLDDYTSAERVQEGGDIAELMGLTRFFPEVDLVFEYVGPRRTTWTDEPLPPSMFAYHEPRASVLLDPPHPPPPRALCFHDSFGPYLASFLPRFFARVAFYWQYQPSAEALAQEEPDLVLQEIGERVLIRDELKGGDVPFPLDPRVREDFEARRAFRASTRVLFARSAPGAAELPAFEPPGEGRAALLRLDLRTSGAGSVRVEPPPAGGPAARSLLRGRNVLYLPLDAGGGAARLVLEAPGVELLALEARAVPAAAAPR